MGTIIQLVNRTNIYPKGVLEDVLAKVDEMIYQVNFYLLDISDDSQTISIPLLLWRSSMKTTCTKIDVHGRELTLNFDREIIYFNNFEAINLNDGGDDFR